MFCPLYQEGKETSQHVFSTCKVTHKVWNQWDSWVGTIMVGYEYTIIHFMSFFIIGLQQCAN